MPLRHRPRSFAWIAVGVIAYTVGLIARTVFTPASLRAEVGLPPDYATPAAAAVVAVAALPTVRALFADADWAAPMFGIWGVVTVAWQLIYANVAAKSLYLAVFAEINNRPLLTTPSFIWTPALVPAIAAALIYWHLSRQRATSSSASASGIGKSAA